MRHFLVKFVRPLLALTFVVCSTMSPSLAGACAWQAYGCKPGQWRADYRPGGYPGWYDVQEALRLGVANIDIVRAATGAYPYQNYGYNNGACIAYRVVCDQWGNVIGEEPVLVC